MIRKLPQDVVDRIAAGEVVERPASVVKELVENSLDAGARRVTVEIEGGGRDRIVVHDDGEGIESSELRLAFEPHATSKLGDLEDLDRIASFGFRGEALASIAAVSRTRILSRARDSEEGAEVVCEAGRIDGPRPRAAPPGTTVEVRRLFFNVPARARFLKSAPTEAARCVEQTARAALAHEGVGFTMLRDGRELFRIEPELRLRERIARLHGADLAGGLLPVEGRSVGGAVGGFVGRPELAKRRSARQWLFLNGRPIGDGTVRAAVAQAFREYLAASLQPVYYLFLHVDPADVDVNVHPAKSEVRFRHPEAVFRLVRGAVLAALSGHDLARRPRLAERPLVESAPGPGAPLPAATGGRAIPSAIGSEGAETVRDAAGAGSEAAEGRSAVPPRTGAGFFVLFRTYVLYESGDELVVVDQHALHERILYEDLRREARRGAVRSQRLLVPEVATVGSAGVLRLEALAGALSRMGFEVSALSETEVAVHAVPTLLARRSEAVDVVRRLLEEPPVEGGDDLRGGALLRCVEERLHTVACHAAVRAGDPLADEEIEALLRRAEALPEAKACPHGRPTALRLSRGELERWFGRRGL